MSVNRSLLYGFMFVLLSLTACGGGGSSSAPAPTTATLKLSTSGTLPQGTSLAGIGITLTLPAGVTIQTDSSGAVATGYVNVTGEALPESVISVYIPASGATPATLALAVISTTTTGFGTGEFVTVTCDLNGTSPKSSDFVLSGFKPYDLSGNPVNGLTASVL
jgi:hypothetical protein